MPVLPLEGALRSLSLRGAKRSSNPGLSLMRTHFVIVSVAWQSRRRSNGGSSTYVQTSSRIPLALSLSKDARNDRLSGYA